jgi:hypothetical protein
MIIHGFDFSNSSVKYKCEVTMACKKVRLIKKQENNSNKDRDKKRRLALKGLKKIRKAKFRDVDNKANLSINHDQYLDEIYAMRLPRRLFF